MVFLAAAGPPTESAVGPLRFFTVYIVGGLAGVLAHWAMLPGSTIPLIGASGAIAAEVALGAVRFYRTRVVLAPGLSAPVLAIALLWLVLQGVGGFVSVGESAGGTAYWAHAGGGVAGLLLALALRSSREADREASHQAITEMAERGPGATLAAAERHLDAHPEDVNALLEQGEALAGMGERGRAGQAFRLAFEQGGEDQQIEVAARAARCHCLRSVPSLRRTLLAERIRESQPDLARALLESVVEEPRDDGQRPDALLALAELRRAVDPDGARRLVGELFQTYPIHPAADLARARGWSP